MTADREARARAAMGAVGAAADRVITWPPTRDSLIAAKVLLGIIEDARVTLDRHDDYCHRCEVHGKDDTCFWIGPILDRWAPE